MVLHTILRPLNSLQSHLQREPHTTSTQLYELGHHN
jgi:hypothetical protein